MRWHYENWYGRASKSYMQGQQDDSASKITCFSKFNSKNPLTSESLASNVPWTQADNNNNSNPALKVIYKITIWSGNLTSGCPGKST